ncbi:MAG: methylamine, partial [Pseudomonadota bacterium]
MGGALAERFAREGHATTYVSPAGSVSPWTIHSNEQGNIHARLRSLGVALRLTERVTGYAHGLLSLADVYSEEPRQIEAGTLLIVGARQAEDRLAVALEAEGARLTAAGIRTLSRIGDALAPGAIVHAVWSGHHRGETLGTEPEQVLRDAPISSLCTPEVRPALSA